MFLYLYYLKIALKYSGIVLKLYVCCNSRTLHSIQSFQREDLTRLAEVIASSISTVQ